MVVYASYWQKGMHTTAECHPLTEIGADIGVIVYIGGIGSLAIMLILR